MSCSCPKCLEYANSDKPSESYCDECGKSIKKKDLSVSFDFDSFDAENGYTSFKRVFCSSPSCLQIWEKYVLYHYTGEKPEVDIFWDTFLAS